MWARAMQLCEIQSAEKGGDLESRVLVGSHIKKDKRHSDTRNGRPKFLLQLKLEENNF